MFYDLKEKKSIDVLPPISVALGCFDGVHIGHQVLLEKVIEQAAQLNLKPAVWTFSSNYKGNNIDCENERIELFGKYGIKYGIFENFDNIKDLSPHDFVKNILVDSLHCGCIVCGFNFRFGKSASGDVQLLKKLLSDCNIPLYVVPPVSLYGITVSSSEIKEKLKEGKISEVTELLGRPFAVCSDVVHGKALGRTFGFPTANQSIPATQVRPRFGVYFTKITIDNTEYCGISNIGCKPTVNDSDNVNAESYIFKFSGDLYGKQIKTELIKFLRDERKFNSKKELVSAIESDIMEAKKFFGI